jgi:hypothetical protein
MPAQRATKLPPMCRSILSGEYLGSIDTHSHKISDIRDLISAVAVCGSIHNHTAIHAGLVEIIRSRVGIFPDVIVDTHSAR